jgi:hypothetical protein
MNRDEVLVVIRTAIGADVTPAGTIRMPVLSESGEQVAIDVLDALESAGFAIIRREEN